MVRDSESSRKGRRFKEEKAIGMAVGSTINNGVVFAND